MGQRHAVMTGVVERVGGSKYRQIHHIRDGLNAQSAGNDHDILRTFGYHVLQLPGRLGLIAQKINPGAAGDRLSMFGGELLERIAIGFIKRFKFLEALVASEHEQVIPALEYGRQLVSRFQLILGIIYQLLTLLSK